MLELRLEKRFTSTVFDGGCNYGSMFRNEQMLRYTAKWGKILYAVDFFIWFILKNKQSIIYKYGISSSCQLFLLMFNQ